MFSLTARVRAQRFLFAVSLLAATVVACKKDETHPPVGDEGSPSLVPPGGTTEASTPVVTDAAVDGGLLDGAVCSDLTAAGSVIAENGVLSDPPTPTGGTIVDGTYDLQKYVIYVGASGTGGLTGTSAQASIRILTGDIESISIVTSSSGGSTTATKGAYSATDTSFVETELCPVNGTIASFTYSASNSVVVLTNLSTNEEFTYTLR